MCRGRSVKSLKGKELMPAKRGGNPFYESFPECEPGGLHLLPNNYISGQRREEKKWGPSSSNKWKTVRKKVAGRKKNNPD